MVSRSYSVQSQFLVFSLNRILIHNCHAELVSESMFMKIIAFIKKNISVFSVFALIILFSILFIHSNKNDFIHAKALVNFFKIILLIVVFIILILDLLLKKYFSDKIKLNTIQIITIIIVSLYYYFKIIYKS